MTYSKKYKNGLKLVIEKIEGLFSVSAGVIVKTGSVNEDDKNNGISHFIEHAVFKGTEMRSAFEISDYIDRIGASINAFTSKELTCYYTKSTSDHVEETLEVLSDITFNPKFDFNELEKEKGVIIEEINMSEDSSEDILFDLLAESSYGKVGLGRTILGPASNIRKFNSNDVESYRNNFYTADNTVISIAGNVDIEQVEKYVEKYFVNNFTSKKRLKNNVQTKFYNGKLHKYKKIEQCHLGIAMPAFSLSDERRDALSVASVIFGGGMSSRLFQKIREEMGLAYSVYSYVSAYENSGVLEIYAGVNPDARDKATQKIMDEIKRFVDAGITDAEFMRGREQIKSAFIMGRESTSSQMLLFGKQMTYFGNEFNVEDKLKTFDQMTKEDVEKVIRQVFTDTNFATATVGPKKTSLKI